MRVCLAIAFWGRHDIADIGSLDLTVDWSPCTLDILQLESALGVTIFRLSYVLSLMFERGCNGCDKLRYRRSTGIIVGEEDERC